jgi:hypothetical protein
MALTDSESYANAKRPAPVPPVTNFVSPQTSIPHEYLARLPQLHAEAAETLRLGHFVANSVPVAGLLILAGGATLLAGGGSLQSDFVWSLLVLAGIAAMAVNYMRGPGRSLRRTNLESSAADLRAILLYTGFAWGAGAFLALPSDPGLAIAAAFVLGPVLLAVLLLKDEGGIAAFTAPAAVLTACAALLKSWTSGHLVSLAVLAAAVAVILFSYLRDGRARPATGRAA